MENQLKKYIPDNVTTEVNDLAFGHDQFVAAISDSIQNTDPPFTIGIFGGWGTGKSSILEAVQNNLNSKKYRTVFIDAWRYTSADNLKRAFLARVAHVIGKKHFEKVLGQIYAQRQEKTTNANIYSNVKADFSIINLFKITGEFLALSIVLSLLFLLIISLYVLVSGFFTQGISFEWQRVFSIFENLFFVPFITALINFVRPYVSNEPVVITHDPIDADEQFITLFSEVIDSALEEQDFDKTRLVIFVDNLDRLGDKKIIEALEGLKGYLDNKKCVFVVAIDDAIVKKVIDNSEFARTFLKQRSEENSAGESEESPTRESGLVGEDYLEKFFQHSFRLPVQMELGLQDFAASAFAQTITCSEIEKDIDLQRLITILIPQEIGTPRKVKRLLNDFITLYDISKRRESESSSQLSKGSLTGNVYLLAKFSTIQSEYQDFYNSLLQSPELLVELTDAAKNSDQEHSELLGFWKAKHKGNLLINYLLRTRQFVPSEDEDAGKYIYLTEDRFAIALGREKTKELLTILGNGDTASFEQRVLTQSEEENTNELKVAYRFLSIRARGIEELNWSRVIAHMLEHESDVSQKRIAANTISPVFLNATKDDIKLISMDELLSVLRWSSIGGRSEQSRILMEIFQVDPENSFPVIVDNLHMVQPLGVIPEFENYFKQLFVPTNADENVQVELLNWFLVYAQRIEPKSKGLKEFYLGTLAKYLGQLIVRFDTYENGISYHEDDEELELDWDFLVSVFNIIGEASLDEPRSELWNVIYSLYSSSDSDVQGVANDWLAKNIEAIGLDAARKLLQPHMESWQKILNENQNIEENDLEEQLRVSQLLANKIGGPDVFTAKQQVSFLGLITQLNESGFDELVLKYIEDLIPKKTPTYVDALHTKLVDFYVESSDGTLYLEWLLSRKIKLSTAEQERILLNVEELLLSESKEEFNVGAENLEILVNSKTQTEAVKNKILEWADKLTSPAAAELFDARLELLKQMIRKSILGEKDLVSNILPKIPYANNQEQLRSVLDLLNDSELLAESLPVSFLIQVSGNIGELGSISPEFMAAAVPAFSSASNETKALFLSGLQSEFDKNPSLLMNVFRELLSQLSKQQVSAYVSFLLESEFDNNREDQDRDIIVQLAVKRIFEIGEYADLMNLWKSIVLDDDKLHFVDLASNALGETEFDINELEPIRAHAIEKVQGSADLVDVEEGLVLLALTSQQFTPDTMKVVNAFSALLIRDVENVEMALRYLVTCFPEDRLESQHKRRLIESLKLAKDQNQTLENQIVNAASQIGLRKIWYLPYW